MEIKDLLAKANEAASKVYGIVDSVDGGVIQEISAWITQRELHGESRPTGEQIKAKVLEIRQARLAQYFGSVDDGDKETGEGADTESEAEQEANTDDGKKRLRPPKPPVKRGTPSKSEDHGSRMSNVVTFFLALKDHAEREKPEWIKVEDKAVTFSIGLACRNLGYSERNIYWFCLLLKFYDSALITDLREDPEVYQGRVYELNEDGSVKRDKDNARIPDGEKTEQKVRASVHVTLTPLVLKRSPSYTVKELNRLSNEFQQHWIGKYWRDYGKLHSKPPTWEPASYGDVKAIFEFIEPKLRRPTKKPVVRHNQNGAEEGIAIIVRDKLSALNTQRA